MCIMCYCNLVGPAEALNSYEGDTTSDFEQIFFYVQCDVCRAHCTLCDVVCAEQLEVCNEHTILNTVHNPNQCADFCGKHKALNSFPVQAKVAY